ncbi:MAG: hypothetical protein WC683_01085 [bacterium]
MDNENPRDLLLASVGLPPGMSDDEVVASIGGRACTRADLRCALDYFRQTHVPMHVELRAFVRGPHPRGFWVPLVEWLWRWAARHLQYEEIQ